MVKTQKAPNAKNSKQNSKKKLDADPLQTKIPFTVKSSKPTSKTCIKCKEIGSLISCKKCAGSFHLACLGLSENQVTFTNWICVECLGSYDKQLSTEAKQHLTLQKKEKESFSGKIFNKLSEIKEETQIQKFKNKYPEYIKGDKINYPIPDELLWENQGIHEISLKEKPIPNKSHIDPKILGNILFICDFLYTFKEILQIDPISFEDVYKGLSSKYENEISKKVHVSLLRPILQHMARKENTDKSINRGLSYLLYKSSKIIDLDDILDSSYLVIYDYALFSGLWKEIIESAGIEANESLKAYPLLSQYNTNYSIEDKIQLISTLIIILLDSLAFYQEITDRIENLSNLKKEKHEINAQLRAIQKSHPEKSQNKEELQLQDRLKQILGEIKEIKTRTECIGKDRDYNEYFIFPWEKRYIFVKCYKPIEDGKESESGYWYYYDKKKEVNKLLKYFNSKGEREAKLTEALNKALEGLELTEDGLKFSSKSEEVEHSDLESIIELEDPTEDLKSKLKKLYVLMKNNLGVCNSEIELILNEETASAESIKKYFKAISEITGCEQMLQESDEEKEKEEEPSKHRKIELQIWSDFSDIQYYWSQYLEEAKDTHEFFICYHILAEIVKKYIKEHQHHPTLREENSYNLARKSYRLARLSKIKHYEEDRNQAQDDECFICGEDDGTLLCCDGCPKVVHQECVMLEKIPEGDWYCNECVEKANAMRMTRGRLKLSKLRDNLSNN
ncbi:unnamed protein product [Blepharisma stoltei]|uniref:PHD-type domain-containing protein n=1 Tax=Blepharisma stoltei TaxID=1481888 RepID=A0AAU9JCK9_9CILI|nr:unnamed protein product [Blepharisma stoltei]